MFTLVLYQFEYNTGLMLAKFVPEKINTIKLFVSLIRTKETNSWTLVDSDCCLLNQLNVFQDLGNDNDDE